MTGYECLRCGTRLSADEGVAAGERRCPECGGPLRDLALPRE